MKNIEKIINYTFNNKKTTGIVIASVLFLVFFASVLLKSYSLYVDTQNGYIMGGNVFISKGDMSLKIYAQKTNEDGSGKYLENGQKDYERIYYVPKIAYAWNSGMTKCYNGAEIVDFSDYVFTINSVKKGMCKVYFDVEDRFTPDTSVKLYVERNYGKEDYEETEKIPSNDNEYILDTDKSSCTNTDAIISIENNYINIETSIDTKCDIYAKIKEKKKIISNNDNTIVIFGNTTN